MGCGSSVSKNPKKLKLPIHPIKTIESKESVPTTPVTRRSNRSSTHKKAFLLHEDIRHDYKFDPKIIGSGHFGNVRMAKLCNSTVTGKTFAVKTLSKEKIAKELHLVKRELEILSEIDHPNIVRFYNCYEDDKFFHVVMEHCSGGELLDKFLEQGGYIDEKECSLIFEKLLSAVKYLHEHGIVHRDLKPENMLFSDKSPDAEIKLIDFGLSRKIGNMKNLDSVVGTPLYVAPEVLMGSYDQRCDYWSIGTLLYLMLGGSPPFDGDSRADIFEKILKGKFTFEGSHWKKISNKAKDLISKLLVVDPDNRYDATQALEHPWFKHPVPKLSSETRQEIMSNLTIFTKSNRFRKEALNVVVSYFDDKEIKKLRDAFRFYDKENNGEITMRDLQIVFSELGCSYSREEIQKLIEQINIEPSDTISYSDFIAAALDSRLYLTKEKLWMTFKHFDTDNSNYITESNLKIALIKSGKLITDDEAKKILSDADLKKDGKVSFDEFCSMMLENPELKTSSSLSPTLKV